MRRTPQTLKFYIKLTSPLRISQYLSHNSLRVLSTSKDCVQTHQNVMLGQEWTLHQVYSRALSGSYSIQESSWGCCGIHSQKASSTLKLETTFCRWPCDAGSWNRHYINCTYEPSQDSRNESAVVYPRRRQVALSVRTHGKDSHIFSFTVALSGPGVIPHFLADRRLFTSYDLPRGYKPRI